MRLEQLLTSYVGPASTPVARLDATEPDPSEVTRGTEDRSARSLLPRIGFLLSLGLIGTAFALVTRKRSPESC